MKSTPVETIQDILKSGQSSLITDPSNVRYLSNFHGTNGQAFITKKKAYFLTDPRYFREAKKTLPKKMTAIKVTKSLTEFLNRIITKERIKIVYFEEKNVNYLTYKLFRKKLDKVKLKPQSDMVENLRITKNPQEIKFLIKAQRISEKIFGEVRKNLKKGKSELQVSHEIIDLAYKYGADEVSFPPIIAFGSNSGVPHHSSGRRKLKKGDIVLIDMGMRYKGHCSDMTRMVFTAKPTPLQEKIYNIVLNAQETAIKNLKTGIKGTQIDNLARKIMKKSGYGPNFTHSLGHGTGLQIHELPSLSKHYGNPLPENSVVTVEPGIYLEKSFGVRIEDMVLVKGKKAHIITRIPKKIGDSIIEI